MIDNQQNKLKLGDLFTLEYGSGLPEQMRTNYGYPVYGSNGEVGKHKDYLVKGPGIIVGRKGTVGKVVWSDESFFPIDTTYYVVPKQKLSLRWLFWYLNRLPLRRLDSSTGVPGLNRNDVYDIPAHFPNYNQQEQIAEILEQLDQTIQATRSLIEKLKVAKDGLLHDLLTRGLDEHGNLRDPERQPEAFKDTVLGRVPKDWEIRNVGELFEMQLGKMLSKVAKTGRNSFPYLANRNVQWNHIDLSDLEEMDFSETERIKFALQPFDLLVCEGGEVGRTAMWKREVDGIYFQKALHRLRPIGNNILPNYMLRYMRYAAMRGQFTDFTSQTSISHLTQEKLATLPIPLPKAEEQSLIVEAFDFHEARNYKEQNQLEKLETLKKGLMEDLLTGQVRVSNVKSLT
jgi:type I restriction enzyme, S subunit